MSQSYTKESNSLIERINLIIINKVRSILIQSNAPYKLQGEAIKAATFLYNRTPYLSPNNKTLYKVYNNNIMVYILDFYNDRVLYH